MSAYFSNQSVVKPLFASFAFYMVVIISLGLNLSLSSGLKAETISPAHINTIRSAVGLNTLSSSAALIDAAESHVQYLQRYTSINHKNSGSAHEQKKGLAGFSGKFASDRAKTFHYPHSQILENISLGNENITDSVADLMSAIYHRFAFLDYDISEIGAAYRDKRYVYNMGQADLSLACTAKPNEAALGTPHFCLDKQMSESAYQTMCASLPKDAKFKPPYPVRCNNGNLLRQDFMQASCQSPPRGAILKGAGSYVDACGNGSKINLDWFNKICASTLESVRYTNSPNQYTICEPGVNVYANWYESFCAKLPEDSLRVDSGRYYDLCYNGFKLKSEYYKGLQISRLNLFPNLNIEIPRMK